MNQVSGRREFSSHHEGKLTPFGCPLSGGCKVGAHATRGREKQGQWHRGTGDSLWAAHPGSRPVVQADNVAVRIRLEGEHLPEARGVQSALRTCPKRDDQHLEARNANSMDLPQEQTLGSRSLGTRRHKSYLVLPASLEQSLSHTKERSRRARQRTSALVGGFSVPHHPPPHECGDTGGCGARKRNVTLAELLRFKGMRGYDHQCTRSERKPRKTHGKQNSVLENFNDCAPTHHIFHNIPA
jgi:hypothetical protein